MKSPEQVGTFCQRFGTDLIQNVNFGQSTDPSVNDGFPYSVQHATVENLKMADTFV